MRPALNLASIEIPSLSSTEPGFQNVIKISNVAMSSRTGNAPRRLRRGRRVRGRGGRAWGSPRGAELPRAAALRPLRSDLQGVRRGPAAGGAAAGRRTGAPEPAAGARYNGLRWILGLWVVEAVLK